MAVAFNLLTSRAFQLDLSLQALEPFDSCCNELKAGAVAAFEQLCPLVVQHLANPEASRLRASAASCYRSAVRAGRAAAAEPIADCIRASPGILALEEGSLPWNFPSGSTMKDPFPSSSETRRSI